MLVSDLYCPSCRNAKDHKPQDNEVCWSCVAMGGAGNYKESKTNADRIRAMTDEELAELLTAVAQKSANKLCESLKTVEVDLSNCNFQILYEAHLEWLKEEVEDS